MQERQIIVVDEDSIASEVLAMLLRRQGYKVLTCVSAEQAIQAMRKIQTHLVICDTSSANLDAPDFADKVAACHPLCLFIFLGPVEDLATMLHGARLHGHTAYAHTKPIYPSALFSKLDLMFAHT